MKDLHLPLNQTQRVRFETALHELQMLTPTTVLAAAVTIADTIPVNHEDSILRGHWTSDQKGKLVSTLCGVVEWVDKLVHVRTLRTRYRPEICDILVGRVSKIGPESWRLEINSKQDAVMKFSSINFPDVIQAEICAFNHDGSPELQPMDQKYGKLERGQLLMVPPYLVKRQNQHHYHLEQYGVDLILGRNGFIWVGEHAAVGEKTKLMGTELGNFTPLETRNHVCRLANAHFLQAGTPGTGQARYQSPQRNLPDEHQIDDLFPSPISTRTKPGSMRAISSAAGGMLRARLRGAARVRGGGEGAGRWTTPGHEEQPKGYLFNRPPPPPGESRKWEDWELPCYVTSFLTVVILGVGLNAKPDLTIETWAHKKALERLQQQELAAAEAQAE
ncbi:hypothetical protein C2845_PM03G01430 [Panicum miliaceum]|uniref:Uncharacterized protein n=1 Tax=Panicum miliaceum TaxID=4540 RepID=A0A3L6T9U0_PANMI|nr:hypothetical protein C2845_PM03G01430 [Panicum miliaceum]